MAKKADVYFKVDPWSIVEEDYSPEYGRVAESIFSLGNEYMGIRGFFEEGYSGKTLLGSYFNGIYEKAYGSGSAYKGIASATEYMVNSVNWLYTRIFAGGEKLDLHTGKFKEFKRILDLKSGVLTRSFIWLVQDKEIKITFERFLSMEKANLGGQKIKIESLNFSGDMEVVLGLDLNAIHENAGQNRWNDCEMKMEENQISIMGTTQTTNQKVFSCGAFFGATEQREAVVQEEKLVGNRYRITLTPGEEKEIGRVVYHYAAKNGVVPAETKVSIWKDTASYSYEKLKEENQAWWEKVWNRSDIVIDGDEKNQQGIRFCIFQMFQTYHGTEPGTNIGAKGLTGEAYNGNAFWDTETYCLPFYVFNDVKAARNLLMFRYLTLEAAKRRAEELDCKGAFYPIATISGNECCNLWQHASLQLQASTAVAYGIWFYVKQTGDEEFLYQYGAEMLIAICRMLATRGDFSQDGTRYGYYGVMGPDEFQMMVNHNYYTNQMAAFTFRYTLEILELIEKKEKISWDFLKQKTAITEEEKTSWAHMEKVMYIPYDSGTKLYEQHEGFFQLPHVDIHQIPVEEFPLYHHWTYDRIYRNDMIKQPDVLMLMLLFNSSYSEEELKANYEFYEPRCIHESSLSPSVHSILASQLGKEEEAYNFFQFATRMDLDNYNRNTHEGLHTTSIAAAWMNIVYGFGGMRSDGDILSFAPTIPKEWEGYSFRISYRDETILVSVDKEKAVFSTLGKTKLEIKIYNKVVSIGGDNWETTISA